MAVKERVDHPKYLEACCCKVFFDFETGNLEPGNENWVRDTVSRQALVNLVREVWIESCGGVATDWPWNEDTVMKAFIRMRKKTTEQKNAMRADLQQGSLFPPDIGTIYFIRNTRNHVKIGHTDGDVEVRLKQLQTAESEKLIISGTVRGTEPQEKAFHVRFAAFRIRREGEWFYSNDELERIIKENRYAGH